MNSRTIELSGHVIDSLTLPKALDIIMDKGGDFDFLEFDVGKRKTDTSKVKMAVYAESIDLLNSILDELSVLGASISELKEVVSKIEKSEQENLKFAEHLKNQSIQK